MVIQRFNKFYNSILKLYDTKTIFPLKENIFNALKLTDYSNVKVVIIGQDPYHGVGEAHGLSFSVLDGVKIPPSLQNIYKELKDDIGLDTPKHGDLSEIVKEGVFLLNATLTVRKNSPLSHEGKGWETFTDNVIKIISEKVPHADFILWGNNAKEKERLIDKDKHLIIKSAHPSPLSAYNGFFGSKPFSKANRFLMHHEILPIDYWVLLNE